MLSATYHSSSVSLDGLPKDKKPHIAMVGRSNVGKSSMINHLTSRRNLARVSSKPGRTQTINLYDIDNKFFLVDLPGYGFAKKSVEQREKFADMILDYLKEAPHLKLVLLIIDARIPLSDLDAEMLAWLQENRIPFVLIANKIDQLKKQEVVNLHAALDEKYSGVTRLDHSVDSVKNKNEILQTIAKALKS
jgi:GTP-binding protein